MTFEIAASVFDRRTWAQQTGINGQIDALFASRPYTFEGL
eukprot:gene2481-4670_t